MAVFDKSYTFTRMRGGMWAAKWASVLYGSE